MSKTVAEIIIAETGADMTQFPSRIGIAAMAAVRTNGTFWQSRYKRLTSRRGPMRAWWPSNIP
ncbi:hypothetical protein FCN77_05790 [Arthrobacter sp. 24S4-2]|uniref:hypothetical protein n=1 Tax=Arthrobacter sp. 24S4-2 TaxID=2575374 RepID=UPI0010C7B70C|nr:hypothetical protein FCN77_05790 [Arthrobacter sp. 24S4-2]